MAHYKVLKIKKLAEKRSNFSFKTIHKNKEGELPYPDVIKICQYEGDEGFYLIRFDGDDAEIADTYHSTFQEAIEQACFEYNLDRREFQFLKSAKLAIKGVTYARRAATAHPRVLRQVQTGERAAVRNPYHHDPKNVVVKEMHLDDLVARMEKPLVQDLRLKGLVDDLYRPSATAGSGSSASAVRAEKLTGMPVRGEFHAKKCEQYTRRIESWIEQNKNNTLVSSQDKITAENLVRDMKNSLGVQ